MKFAYLACPVRGHDADEYGRYVQQLEGDGWMVHWPPRDTFQADTELGICIQNKYAVQLADRVFVVWDGKSEGVLFDLGMALAFNKPITVLSLPPETPTKSFQNMIRQWEKA